MNYYYVCAYGHTSRILYEETIIDYCLNLKHLIDCTIGLFEY